MCRLSPQFSTLETFLAYSQAHLKGKIELPPPKRPGPYLPVPALGVRFLAAPLDGEAARPGRRSTAVAAAHSARQTPRPANS